MSAKGRCAHDWRPSVDVDGTARLGRQHCARCGATCERDRTSGAILAYDAGVPHEEHQRWTDGSAPRVPRPE